VVAKLLDDGVGDTLVSADGKIVPRRTSWRCELAWRHARKHRVAIVGGHAGADAEFRL